MALNLNQNAQNAHGVHEIRMIYDDLCSEFAEIVVFKAIPSFTDVRKVISHHLLAMQMLGLRHFSLSETQSIQSENVGKVS